MNVGRANAVAAQARYVLDDYLRGRRLPDGLDGTIYLAIEDRLARGLEPPLREEVARLVDRFAIHPRWQR